MSCSGQGRWIRRVEYWWPFPVAVPSDLAGVCRNPHQRPHHLELQQSIMSKIGFIGLGIMGDSIAANLV